MKPLTTLIHIYYPGSWYKIRSKCKSLLEMSQTVIITVCSEAVRKEIDQEQNIVLLKVPNLGKDIGGKLVSLEYYLTTCERTAYLALLHDKISPQTINANHWFESLYSIFEKEKLDHILTAFSKDKKAGIIGSKEFLKNEYSASGKNFRSTNNEILKQLIHRYALHIKNYDFIAGTIFMIRSGIYERFFLNNNPLEIRGVLERGNVLDLYSGSRTHSWERLLSFIAADQNFSISGI